MKICVCSDSHGNSHGILHMLQTEKPDGLIFLGDGWRDIDRDKLAPGTMLAVVAGNCDLGCAWPEERLIDLFGARVLLTHGHRQRVKQGLSALAEYAAALGAQIALYGHTHMAGERTVGGVLLLNPGSISSREDSYMVLTGGGELKYEHRALRW